MSPRSNRRAFLLIIVLIFVLLLQPGDSWWRRRRRRRRPSCSPVDCKWKHNCSTTCGSGVKVFVKTVSNSCGGKCTVPKPTPCKIKECPPVNCEVGLWGAWGQCSHTCGKIGKKQRERAITTQPLHSGKACPALAETLECKSAVEKCKYNKGPCSVTCGKGFQKFTLVKQSACLSCKSNYTKACHPSPCPVNCEVGLWGAWGQCSHTCGKIGKKQRERAITTQPLHSGKACPALVETLECKSAVEKCKYNKGPCSVTCGKGFQKFTLVKQSACLSCKSNYTKACHPSPCPVHCNVSSWGAWSKCSNTCGGAGMQERRRRVMTKARHKGDVCPVLKETKVCKTAKEKCHWRLGACSAKCGRGWRVYHLVKKNYCGNCKMPPARVPCFGRKCKAHCVVFPWSRWSKCVGNVRVRTRKVLRRPQHGGTKCPILKQKRVGCGRKMNCVWKWGACVGSIHHSCIGVQRPVVTKQAKNGGCCQLPKARSCRKKRPKYGDRQSIALDSEDEFNEDDIIQLQEILGMHGNV